MKIEIQTSDFSPVEPARIGNVYAMRGGRAARDGKMMVLFAISKGEYDGPRCLMLIINRDGEPTGVTAYGMHYIVELQPIAFVEGLEEMTLVMRSI
jgi:hypothetical protein